MYNALLNDTVSVAGFYIINKGTLLHSIILSVLLLSCQCPSVSLSGGISLTKIGRLEIFAIFTPNVRILSLIKKSKGGSRKCLYSSLVSRSLNVYQVRYGTLYV